MNALELPADDADELHVLLGLHVGRAAEHHVLEHVGEALPVRPLVARADVVEHADVDDRGDRLPRCGEAARR